MKLKILFIIFHIPPFLASKSRTLIALFCTIDEPMRKVFKTFESRILTSRFSGIKSENVDAVILHGTKVIATAKKNAKNDLVIHPPCFRIIFQDY